MKKQPQDSYEESPLAKQAVERVRSLFDPLGGLPLDLTKLGLPAVGSSFPRVYVPDAPELPVGLPEKPPEEPARTQVPRIAPVFPNSLKVPLAHLCQALIEADQEKTERFLKRSLEHLCELFSGQAGLEISDKASLLTALEDAPAPFRRVFYDGDRPLKHTQWLQGEVGGADLQVLNAWLGQAEQFFAHQGGPISLPPESESIEASLEFEVVPETRELMARGKEALERGATGAALQDLDRAIRLLVEGGAPGAELVRAYHWRARAYERQGQLYRALLDMGRAVEAARRCGAGEKEALRERLHLLQGQMMDAEALEDAGRLLELADSDDERSTLLGLRARQLEARGRWEAAIADYQRAAELCQEPLLRVRYLRLAVQRLKTERQAKLWTALTREVEKACREGEDFARLLPLEKVVHCLEVAYCAELARALYDHLEGRLRREGQLEADLTALAEELRQKVGR